MLRERYDFWAGYNMIGQPKNAHNFWYLLGSLSNLMTNWSAWLKLHHDMVGSHGHLPDGQNVAVHSIPSPKIQRWCVDVRNGHRRYIQLGDYKIKVCSLISKAISVFRNMMQSQPPEDLSTMYVGLSKGKRSVVQCGPVVRSTVLSQENWPYIRVITKVYKGHR